MKRAKRSIPTVKTFVGKKYEISCPHCNTYLIGGFNERVLRFLCHNCHQPIMVDWDFLNEEKNDRQ